MALRSVPIKMDVEEAEHVQSELSAADRQVERALGRPPGKVGTGVFLLLAAVIIGIAAWGVWGIYNYYVPAVAVARDFSLGIVAVSILAGLAAFFSPCAFGLLPSYLGFYAVASPTEPRGGTSESALRMGVWAALGIAAPGIILAALLLKLGVPFALGLRIITREPNQTVQAIRIIFAAALVVLGIFQFSGRAFGSAALSKLVSRLPIRAGKAKPHGAAFFLYGVAYLVASVPCAANVMVAPLLFSFATGGIPGAAGTVLLMLLTMGVLMILATLVFALAKDSIMVRVRLLTPEIQRVAGLLMIAMGVVLIYFTLDTRAFFRTFWRFRPPGVP